jgi:hypothetical protein
MDFGTCVVARTIAPNVLLRKHWYIPTFAPCQNVAQIVRRPAYLKSMVPTARRWCRLHLAKGCTRKPPFRRRACEGSAARGPGPPTRSRNRPFQGRQILQELLHFRKWAITILPKEARALEFWKHSKAGKMAAPKSAKLCAIHPPPPILRPVSVVLAWGNGCARSVFPQAATQHGHRAWVVVPRCRTQQFTRCPHRDNSQRSGQTGELRFRYQEVSGRCQGHHQG